MTTAISAPFFEIGPKNLLRRSEIEALAVAAAHAGADHGITVLLTVPTALIAPVQELGTGVRVLAQGMHADHLGTSMNRVIAESLADAGASGVMLNHDADPLTDQQLLVVLERAKELVVCLIFSWLAR